MRIGASDEGGGWVHPRAAGFRAPWRLRWDVDRFEDPHSLLSILVILAELQRAEQLRLRLLSPPDRRAYRTVRTREQSAR